MFRSDTVKTCLAKHTSTVDSWLRVNRIKIASRGGDVQTSSGKIHIQGVQDPAYVFALDCLSNPHARWHEDFFISLKGGE